MKKFGIKIKPKPIEPVVEPIVVLEHEAPKPKPKIIIKKKDVGVSPIVNECFPAEVTTASNSTSDKPSQNTNPTIPIHPDPIDLLANKHGFDLNNENKTIIEQFNLLVTQIEHQIAGQADPEEKKKHRFRLQQIERAITIFEDYPGKITSGAQAQKINGIGKGIGHRIDEILKTGSLAELTNKKYISEYTCIITDLMTITGIGSARAKQLVDDFDVKGVADLKEKYEKGLIKVAKNQLTHHMVIGMKYYEDFKKKIPRAETVMIDEKVLQPTAKALDPDLIVKVCGSFRRQKDFSGDIDVLVSHPKLVTEADVKVCQRKYLIEFVNAMIANGFLVDSLTDKGQTKYMGVCHLAGVSECCHRIDIRFVPYDCFAPGVLYFTGSWLFNKIFRGVGNSKDLTINEYGIYHFPDRKKGDKIVVFSEEDIFKIVGVKYLEPWQRDF